MVAFAQRHAEHFRPRTSQVGTQDEVEMKGPVWRDNAVAGSSIHLRLHIRLCIQAKFAWERHWCHNNNSFWELNKCWFADPRIDFVCATSSAEYANASAQKEWWLIYGTKGKSGRQLCGHKCAFRINPFAKHTSIFCVVWVVWPPNVESKTWGLRRQTSTPGIWYPWRSMLTTWPAKSSTFHLSKPCRKPFAQPRDSTTREEHAAFGWTKTTGEGRNKRVCLEYQNWFFMSS